MFKKKSKIGGKNKLYTINSKYVIVPMYKLKL